MSSKEKKYFKTLCISTIGLVIIFIISMVFAIKDVFSSQNINAYIFELLYAAFHLILLGFAIILIIQAFKQGSFVIKGLMTEANGKVNYDQNGYMFYQLENSSGKGYYLINGKMTEITWEKDSLTSPTRYYDASGNELVLNVGKTYIAIVPADAWKEVVIK